MLRSIAACGLIALLLTGCSSQLSSNSRSADNSRNADNSNSDSGPAYANRAKPRGDFSTPKAAVETFIRAGTNRDADLLSQCFHPKSPGEFRKFREKTSSAKELDDLSTFVRGAEVIDVKENGDSAVASVAFKERNEKISMKKSAGDWKVLDF